MSSKWEDPRLSRIIELELEITEAIYYGHHPSGNDKFETKRIEIAKLREEVGIKPWFNQPKAKQESSEYKS
jgi:hypothetical protein